MVHENWIPIEMFDKEKYLGAQMFFAAIAPDDFWLEAGYWDCDWGVFYNGDVTFEPTHYLNPACYKKESL